MSQSELQLSDFSEADQLILWIIYTNTVLLKLMYTANCRTSEDYKCNNLLGNLTKHGLVGNLYQDPYQVFSILYLHSFNI